MNSEEKYSKLVKALTKNADVVQPIGKKGFGRNALYFHGRIFVFLSSRKQLVLRLEPERVKELVISGEGICWDPRRDGRVFKNWVVFKRSSKKDWVPLAREGLNLLKEASAPTKRTRNL